MFNQIAHKHKLQFILKYGDMRDRFDSVSSVLCYPIPLASLGCSRYSICELQVKGSRAVVQLEKQRSGNRL